MTREREEYRCNRWSATKLVLMGLLAWTIDGIVVVVGIVFGKQWDAELMFAVPSVALMGLYLVSVGTHYLRHPVIMTIDEIGVHRHGLFTRRVIPWPMVGGVSVVQYKRTTTMKVVAKEFIRTEDRRALDALPPTKSRPIKSGKRLWFDDAIEIDNLQAAAHRIANRACPPVRLELRYDPAQTSHDDD